MTASDTGNYAPDYESSSRSSLCSRSSYQFIVQVLLLKRLDLNLLWTHQHVQITSVLEISFDIRSVVHVICVAY